MTKEGKAELNLTPKWTEPALSRRRDRIRGVEDCYFAPLLVLTGFPAVLDQLLNFGAGCAPVSRAAVAEKPPGFHRRRLSRTAWSA